MVLYTVVCSSYVEHRAPELVAAVSRRVAPGLERTWIVCMMECGGVCALRVLTRV
jgi:hypothetical protein